MSNETWKVIPGYSKYQASNLGQIRNKETKHVLASADDGNGYLQLNVVNDEKARKTVKVHKLVSETFNGPCPVGLEVDHSNDNKYDNRACNLNYMTHGQNQRKAFACGLKNKDNRGRLDVEDVLEMRKLFKLGWSNKELGKRFTVSPNMCSMIRHGVRWAKAA